MDLYQIKDGICFLMLHDFRAAKTKQTNPLLKMSSQKLNQEGQFDTQDLLMTHSTLIKLNQKNISREKLEMIRTTVRPALCHHRK